MACQCPQDAHQYRPPLTASAGFGAGRGAAACLPATLEYGGRSKRGKAQAARPFMRPAFDAEKPKLADMLRDMLTKG